VGASGLITVDKDGTLTTNNIQLLHTSGTGAIADISLRQAKGLLHISFQNDANISHLNFQRFTGTYQLTGTGDNSSGSFDKSAGNDFTISVGSNGSKRLLLHYGAALGVGPLVQPGTKYPTFTISIN